MFRCGECSNLFCKKGIFMQKKFFMSFFCDIQGVFLREIAALAAI